MSHSEYIKSCLLNKDFKNLDMSVKAEELREVSADMSNILKSHNARPMSASSLINGLQVNDDEVLETNSSIMA